MKSWIQTTLGVIAGFFVLYIFRDTQYNWIMLICAGGTTAITILVLDYVSNKKNETVETI